MTSSANANLRKSSEGGCYTQVGTRRPSVRPPGERMRTVLFASTLALLAAAALIFPAYAVIVGIGASIATGVWTCPYLYRAYRDEQRRARRASGRRGSWRSSQ